MNKNNEIKIEIAFLVVIFIISVFIIGYSPFYKNFNSYKIKKGVVVKVEDNLDYNGVVKIGFQDVWVKLGNETIKFSNVLRGNWLLDNYFEKGDNVVILYIKNTPIYIT